MKFGFYTSGNAGRLKKMLENKYFSTFGIEVSFILHDNGHDPVLAELAESNGVETIFVDYDSEGVLQQKGQYISEKIYHLMKRSGVGYLFCFGGKILRGRLLEEYQNRLINFHPSVLPMFPGLKAIDKALDAKAFLMGNTAHFIDEGIDTGPVIMQHLIHWSDYHNYEDILDQQIPMLIQIAAWVNDNRIKAADNRVLIADAQYEAGPFLPRLEGAVRDFFIKRTFDEDFRKRL